MLYIIILWTSSITLPLPSVVYNHSLDKQHYSPLTLCCIQLFSGQAALLSPYQVLYTIFLWTSSITLPLPCVVYQYSLDKQYYSPLTQCCIQSFSGLAVLLSPYPVLYTIILWTSSITLPLHSVVYNHSLDKQHYSPLAHVVYNYFLDKQHYSPLTHSCIQLFSGQASSITLPLPIVVYKYYLDRQHNSSHTITMLDVLCTTSLPNFCPINKQDYNYNQLASEKPADLDLHCFFFFKQATLKFSMKKSLF